MESRIKELQEKYWSGETSVEEEKILKDYNSSQEFSEMESKYFSHLKSSAESNPNIQFSIPIRKFKIPYKTIAAAITVIFVVSAYLFQNTTNENEFIVEDPDEAYAITKDALMAISSGMNKGEVYTTKLSKFYEAKQKIRN